VARHAVCLGVSNQQFQTLPSIRQCSNDAMGMAEFLSHAEPKFVAVSAVDPSAEQVIRLLFETTQKCRVDDQFIFYFSGHGRRGRNRKLYLCAADTDADKLIISGISFDRVLEVIRESALKSVLIVLDCCYSGAAASSILIKSGDDLLGEQEKESFTEGWIILTSTTSVETTAVYKHDELSPFTKEFIAACKKLQTARHQWITIADVYEELRFRLTHQRPKLFGENPAFRICTGRHAGTDLSPEPSLRFRPWNGEYFAFYGLLVLSNFRAWILLNPPGEKIDRGAKNLSGFDVLYNHAEAFKPKLKQAERDIASHGTILSRLVTDLGTRITLLWPTGIEEVTFRRFAGSDKKYVFRRSAAAICRGYPIASGRFIHCISHDETGWTVLETPEDYLKEAFGVSLDYRRTEAHSTESSILILKEDSFARNAKYLSVGRYSQQLINISTVDTKLGEHRKTVTQLTGADERLDNIISSRRLISIPAKGAVTIDTDLQSKRRKENELVDCDRCMDEKEVVVEINTRRYRVPCPICNWDKNKSWMNFFSN
jgi:hypothetical protein